MITLPICRWREEETIEGYHRCSSTKLQHGPNGVQDELCLDCYLCDHPPSDPNAPLPPKPHGVCVHLGEATGERRECSGCFGRVEIKLMVCAVHTKCTTYKQLDGVACCRGCDDYSPAVVVWSI